MAIWIEEDAKVLVQGITGKQGNFHATKMAEYGTNIVGGVTPGKGGMNIDLGVYEVPVWDSMKEAIKNSSADASVIMFLHVLQQMRLLKQQMHLMKLKVKE